MLKHVERQEHWTKVTEELAAEQLKLKTYDKTLLAELKNVKGKRVLDFGSGPGVLAFVLQALGAKVKTFDTSSEMNAVCMAKLGSQNVYVQANEIQEKFFDIAICNLVLCIVEEQEVSYIARKLYSVLKDGGVAYFGFCNPKIFDVNETALDFRMPTGAKYAENHSYRKIKKEGGYEIIETHRPIEWYEKEFLRSGFTIEKTVLTPEYLFNGRKINDFVIFNLSKRRLP